MTLSKMSKDHGIKIMKEGKGAESSNPDDANFNSNYPTKNIKIRDSLQVTADPTDFPDTVVARYEHNFDYAPLFIAYTNSYLAGEVGKFGSAEYVNFDYNVNTISAGATFQENLNAYTTETELVISVLPFYWVSGYQYGVEHTYTVDFILFMEEATPLL